MTDLKPIERDVLHQEMRRVLPNPVQEEHQLDGSQVMIGGDPGEVVVRVFGSQVSVAVFAVVWEGPHSPVVHPKSIGSLNWERLPASRLLMNLHNLIDSARDLRRSTYRNCGRCGETNPPEWMHDEETCQSCAERYLGVVH